MEGSIMEMSSAGLLAALDIFTGHFPEDAAVTAPFRHFAESFDGADLFDRKNFTGHITVSAVVASPGMDMFLLLGHRQLKKWLQPGGHVEASDPDFIAGAVREVGEETGLPRDSYDIMALPDGFPVIDFDSHYIPPSDSKGEGEHFHHDVRFLFRLKRDTPIELDTVESDGYKWVSRNDFPSYFGITRITAKIDEFTCIAEYPL